MLIIISAAHLGQPVDPCVPVLLFSLPDNQLLARAPCWLTTRSTSPPSSWVQHLLFALTCPFSLHKLSLLVSTHACAYFFCFFHINNLPTNTAAGEGPLLADYKEHHTDVSVHFDVDLVPGKLAALSAAAGGLETKFKLSSKISTGAGCAGAACVYVTGVREVVCLCGMWISTHTALICAAISGVDAFTVPCVTRMQANDAVWRHAHV
jgi:hypothetical protein